jgi:hypothetical protein
MRCKICGEDTGRHKYLCRKHRETFLAEGKKWCYECGKIKDLSQFYKACPSGRYAGGKMDYCIECFNNNRAKRGTLLHQAAKMANTLRTRNKKLMCDSTWISRESIYKIYENIKSCEMCHKIFDMSCTGHGWVNPADAPTADRINNDQLGYTRENTHWVCGRCNRAKSDFTHELAVSLVSYLAQGPEGVK